MKPYVLTPRAEQDIGDIWDYIASDNIEAADRVLDALEKVVLKLANTPGIGHMREELADRRHGFFLVYSYLIVYRFDTNPLQIVRILRAARDVQFRFRRTVVVIPLELQRAENGRLCQTGRTQERGTNPTCPTALTKINEPTPRRPSFTYDSKIPNVPPLNALPPNPQEPPIRFPAPPCYVLIREKNSWPGCSGYKRS